MRKPVTAVSTLAAAALLLAACSSGTASSEPTPAMSETPAAQTAAAAAMDTCGSTIEEIAAKAKEEGKVNLIALPDTWANYGGILQDFRDTYGIEAVVANPDASSADELTAVTTLAGQPDKPDSIDIGPSFTAQAIAEGLVEPYKTTNWDEIPDDLKDADGNWIGSYYGILSIGTNTTLVKNAPTSFADLLKPEYKGMVTLNGDPREAGAAFAAVVAASLANGGSYDDITPGIEYFAKLKENGNLQVIDVTEAAVISGDVPIAIDWSYNFPGLAPALESAGFDFQVKTPADAPYASFYAQSVVSDPVHPCAARLWMEHITGDAGALGYIEGGAIPARLAAMQGAGVIPADLAANLPTAEQLESLTFPTQEQVDAMKAQLTEQWGSMVADA